MCCVVFVGVVRARRCTVQYMRFFWKATPDSADHAGVKCKIMRPILYPETFDIFDYCTDDLRATLRTNRDRHGARLDDGMLDAKVGRARMTRRDGAAPRMSRRTHECSPRGGPRLYAVRAARAHRSARSRGCPQTTFDQFRLAKQ